MPDNLAESVSFSAYKVPDGPGQLFRHIVVGNQGASKYRICELPCCALKDSCIERHSSLRKPVPFPLETNCSILTCGNPTPMTLRALAFDRVDFSLNVRIYKVLEEEGTVGRLISSKQTSCFDGG
ncbi:hypothetical protein J3T91_02405 [Bifidobacterium sp. B4001]|uniref:hypothetical protein n=1 Tax=unclassified Bifidobacterium TaxID=2608897 RepID=UPI00226B3059|nr:MULTISPECIES: hypothetical protein [unclassified Bifidobacterium]MCX8672371.1 hypothetical protein [Bifidobacterium sp. B4079]MCX8680805.1 hypothetical protein [Bifidobacterium sp. B4001]